MVVRVRGGPPKTLIMDMLDGSEIENFIETGTFRGNTAVWASKNFDKVKSIEVSEELYNDAVEKYGDIENTDFILGNSAKELDSIIKDISGRSVFWLDAHYMEVSDTGVGESECPLLNELEAIVGVEPDPIIFIDDARFFISPPPHPHSPSEWPDIEEVITHIKKISDEYYICITEGVIIAVPENDSEIVVNYAQQVSAEQWWVVITDDSDIERGIKLLKAGVVEIALSDKVRSIVKTLGIYPVAEKVYRILGAPSNR